MVASKGAVDIMLPDFPRGAVCRVSRQWYLKWSEFDSSKFKTIRVPAGNFAATFRI